MNDSGYTRDPRVPPVRVEKLGKHHKAVPHGLVGLPSAVDPRPRAQSHDEEPTYADFLEQEAREGETESHTG